MQITDANKNGIERKGNARALAPWILAGLLLGGVSGAIYAHGRLVTSSKYLSQWLAISEYDNLALLQYKYANADHARQSLQDLINFMDRTEADHLAPDEQALGIDRALTYMRLALLDEKVGDVKAARAHIAEAKKGEIQRPVRGTPAATGCAIGFSHSVSEAGVPAFDLAHIGGCPILASFARVGNTQPRHRF
jgi:hypothetical protein